MNNPIALLDCNNFYASCERLFNPQILNKPVVVLSNNDGCVIARSEQAKAIGIEMGAPAFMMRDLIEKNNIAVYSSNYTLYGDLSDRVMQTLSSFVPAIEIYSIDEAFLDMTNLTGIDLETLANEIRAKVTQQIGIPVSVGIAATKTLAKMSNRYAKKSGKGYHLLDNSEKVKELLEWTLIEDVWGIGKQHSRRLKWMGIKTAADFVNKLNADWVRTNMTVVGERLLNELKGVPSIEWTVKERPKKGICTARSFGKLLTEKKDIQEALANYAAASAVKLRKQSSCAGVLSVMLQTNIHRTQDKQYARNLSMQLPVATNATNEIIKYAFQVFDIIYRPGYNYKKTGVMLTDLIPATQVQQSMFDKESRSRNAVVMQSLDAINKNLGKDIVRFATQGYKRQWKLKQEKLSPCYTTNFKEILLIKI